MASYRRFWLENQDGDKWYFTEKEFKTFLANPTGLGFGSSAGGFRLGNAEIVNTFRYELGEISGSLLFYNNSREAIYKDYFDFMGFIAKNNALKLHYDPPNSFDSYYCYCFVSGIQKGEIRNDMLVMECPITFKRQTFWRNDKTTSLLVKDIPLEPSKSYPLDRPYSYSSSMLSNMSIVNRGNVDAPLKITIVGTVTNPTFSIYDGDRKYGVMRMLGTFDKVIVNGDDLNENIQLEKDGAILTAPFSYQDLSVGSPLETYVTFIKLRTGASKGVFTYDGVFDGDVILEWSDEYVSV